MTYTQFKSDPDRVARANAVLRDPFVAEMIAAVAGEPMCRVMPLPQIGSTADDKAMALGHQYGFQFFHDRLVGLGVPAPVHEEIPANYLPPNQ